MEKRSGYHRRSLVETKMHYIKLLGDKLSARNLQSQVNEIHVLYAVVLLKYSKIYEFRQISDPSCILDLINLGEP